jgi:WD40 repeat protein
LLPHADQVQAVGFTADGKAVWTASLQESRAWDPATGKALGDPLRHPPGVVLVAFGPDLRTVLLGLQGPRFVAWDLQARKPAYEPVAAPGLARNYTPFAGPAALTWHVGWSVLLARDEHAAVVVDAATDKPLGNEFPLDFWPLHTLGLGRPPPGPPLAVSPDRSCFLIQTASNCVQIRSADGKALGEPLPEDGLLLAAGFGPDGQTLWTESSPKPFLRTFRLRRVAGGKEILVLPPQKGHVFAFTPDGKQLLTGMAREDRFEIVFRNTTTGAVEGDPLPAPAQVVGVTFTPDGRRFAGSAGEKVWVWDVASRKVSAGPLEHSAAVEGLAFGPDGKVLVTWAGNKAWLWEADTGKPVGSPLVHEEPNPFVRGKMRPVRINAAVFSPDGSLVVVGDRLPRPVMLGGAIPGTFTVLDTRTAKPQGQLVHKVAVWDVIFRPDGRYLATLDVEGVMRLWRAGRWECVAFSGPAKGSVLHVPYLGWAPDGRTLTSANAQGDRHVWHPPFPLEGPPVQLRRRLEAQTGQSLDDEGVPHPLDARAWQERRHGAEEAGRR